MFLKFDLDQQLPLSANIHAHMIICSYVYNHGRSSDFLKAAIVDDQLIYTVTKFEIESKINDRRGRTNKRQPHANPLRADAIV